MQAAKSVQLSVAIHEQLKTGDQQLIFEFTGNWQLTTGNSFHFHFSPFIR
jgi:hypothetical protein